MCLIRTFKFLSIKFKFQLHLLTWNIYSSFSPSVIVLYGLSFLVLFLYVLTLFHRSHYKFICIFSFFSKDKLSVLLNLSVMLLFYTMLVILWSLYHLSSWSVSSLILDLYSFPTQVLKSIRFSRSSASRYSISFGM